MFCLVTGSTSELIVRFNPDCNNYLNNVDNNSKVIIMHNPDGEDELLSSDQTPIWLLEGSSIFMKLSDVLNAFIYEFIRTGYDCPTK